MARRFFAGFALLFGIASALLAAWALGRWLIPAVFGAPPPWLPEDSLTGLGYLLASDLFRWLPALVFSALLLTFSYWLKPEDLPPGETQALIRFSILAVAVSALFSVAVLLGEPWVDARLDDLSFRHHQARQLEDVYLDLKKADEASDSPSHLEARLTLLKRLGLLRPNQNQGGADERMDYDFELQILKARLELDDFFRLRALPGTREAVDAGDATVSDLLQRAEAALADATADREYQANLWGYQAYRRLMNAAAQRRPISGADVERAKAVVDASWQRIYARTLATDERLKASYFFRKGKSLGDYQFQNYLESYYGFQELHRENPGDQEVARYWSLSADNIAGRILFLQDMDVLFAVPGSENLVFLNRESPVEIVKIGKLLDTSQGVFLKDFEFLRLDAGGQVLLHWTAPYGRWGDHGVDFRVWDKDSPLPRFPVVLAETPNNEFNPEASVDPPLFEPRVTVRDLEVVNAQQPRPQSLGTWDLLVHSRNIEALGYNSRLFQTEFLVRLGTPFAFFLAFLAVFAVAWRNRAHESGRTWWFLVPILPLVAQFTVQTLLWLSRLGVGGLLAAFGLESAAAILVAAFVALAVAGVILVHRSFHQSLR